MATVIVIPNRAPEAARMPIEEVQAFCRQAARDYRLRPATRPIAAARAALHAHLVVLGFPLEVLDQDQASRVVVGVVGVWLDLPEAIAREVAAKALRARLMQVGLTVESISDEELGAVAQAMATAYLDEPHAERAAGAGA